MMSKALFALAILATVPAQGQALKNHNSNAPVDFEADRIEVQDRADRAILAGNVKVRQGNLALDAALVVTRLEGIIPAIETAHALAALSRMNLNADDVVVVCLSGRGDKDLSTYSQYL